MTPQQFVDALGDYYGKPLSDKQVLWYVRDLNALTCNLETLWDAVRESCKYQPRMAEILEIAAEINDVNKPPATVRNFSEFDVTACPLCRGCGFLEVWHDLDGFKPGPVRAVFGGVGDERRLSYRPRSGERSYTYRCNCGCGNRMPKAWPMYRGTVRLGIVEIEREDEDAAARAERLVEEFRKSKPRVIEEVPF